MFSSEVGGQWVMSSFEMMIEERKAFQTIADVRSSFNFGHPDHSSGCPKPFTQADISSREQV